MSIALTIAGSDSGGGAGIQADLKTFSALGVYGASVITALTAQNTLGVTAVHEAPLDVIAAQLDAVLSDFEVGAAKTGMLSGSGIIEVVADKIRQWDLRALVVDPVMVAKSGDPLLRADAVDALRRTLLPLALVVTPNIPEAEVLAEMEIRDEPDREEAARRLHEMGPRWVVIKGGHLEGDPVDLVWNGRDMLRLPAERIRSTSTHGTGCTFSAAIAALLTRSPDVERAIRDAKEYLTGAIAHAEGLGHGHGPLNHHYRQLQGVPHER
ncbi:MAG: bifunctional hydroxymethylpyrimidine kinase/phosphomethylpyrimidine kinase [Chloroflexi bacterium]|nr:bifunctional hydroxymethylpyrimidine kinase/phosphomethylpyrimidine kinase [Chloroflexota bacterium]